jgi:hypothetical protein
VKTDCPGFAGSVSPSLETLGFGEMAWEVLLVGSRVSGPLIVRESLCCLLEVTMATAMVMRIAGRLDQVEVVVGRRVFCMIP